MNSLKKKLVKNSFAVYGLGASGRSTIKFLKKNKINFCKWDDSSKVRSIFKIKNNKKSFFKSLDKVDWIVVSPGINLSKSKFKKILKKNKKKIITDIDLFYIFNPTIKSIAVTGTNGKSTTCKIIEHIFKKNNIDVKLGGNIGKPVLSLRLKKNSVFILEASSFQLANSKFIKPNYAILLNITNDHLDWHITKKNYVNSKFSIFKNQNKNDFAFLNNGQFINIFYKINFKSKLNKVLNKNYYPINSKIENIYLKSKINQDNMNFVYQLSKKFKITKKSFILSANSFQGLEHRHELFFKKSNITFINDSKATSFEASKHALINNKNIFWIVGGQPKKGDKFNLKYFKKNIIKSFIIGKNAIYFRNKLKKQIKVKVSFKLKNALESIFKEIIKNHSKPGTVLLSPSSASYDQYKNFEKRGEEFKKLVKLYAHKYL